MYFSGVAVHFEPRTAAPMCRCRLLRLFRELWDGLFACSSRAFMTLMSHDSALFWCVRALLVDTVIEPCELGSGVQVDLTRGRAELAGYSRQSTVTMGHLVPKISARLLFDYYGSAPRSPTARSCGEKTQDPRFQCCTGEGSIQSTRKPGG